MVEKLTQGSIIYIDFDPSVRSEVQKRRPAVVVSNDLLIETSPFAWIVPISQGNFDGQDYPLHVHLDKRTQIRGTIYLEQLKSFDFRQRHWQFVEMLPADLFAEVTQKIRLVV